MTNSSPELDEQFIRRAIRLAMNGRGRVEPNPMVGCVLVKDGRVIGEGYHAQFGGPHAEPTALANCTESPAGATAYVTLEPCCHTNKKTPPCAPRLIEAKIARVVIGCLDPNPDVNGKGVAMLRAAGIQVDGPVLEASAKQLIALFLLDIQKTRPYVVAKWAETADRRVAGAGGQRLQISNPSSQKLTHDLRARCDAILVGINTILTDDPVLNARHAGQPRHPSRHVLDRHLRCPPEANVVRDDCASTTIYCGHDTSGPFRHRRDELKAAGADVTAVPIGSDGRLDLAATFKRMRGLWVRSVLVEPGPILAASLFESGLIDRLWVFRSRQRVSEPSAPEAAPIPSTFVKTDELDADGDILIEYANRKSEVFFASEPSADFALAADALTSSRP
jgi:diaminohydroxyphosphoribosylaminopyrimidine deaminase/5-amino-6-(5-phosphoribosylamino)uracil reductase